MKKMIFTLISLSLIMILITPSAVHGAETDVTLTLSFTNLADPGTDHYEGWLIVDGSAITTGKFTVDSAGDITDLDGNALTSFEVPNIDLDLTTKFVLTLELEGDTDAIPHSIKPLAGDLNADKTSGALSQNTGADFSSVSGDYILATPTDGADNNENSGIWFLSLASGSPAAGLDLPDLNGTDWIYEGWVVIDGVPVTTGTFDNLGSIDNFDGFSSTQGGPPFPGEDFLVSAPTGLTFPTDIAGDTAVISIEPREDNSDAPFQFKPLVGAIPADAADHSTYSMDDMTSAFASGTVSVEGNTGFLPGFSFLAVISIMGIISLISVKRRND